MRCRRTYVLKNKTSDIKFIFRQCVVLNIFQIFSNGKFGDYCRIFFTDFGFIILYRKGIDIQNKYIK